MNDDLISRQAVIEAAFEYRVDEIENDYDKGYSAAVHDICKMLKKIPSAQPEQRWIPCSSGNLPQTTDPVNITWTNRNPEPYYASIKDIPFTATGHYHNGKWWWYSATCQDYLDEYGESEVDRVDDGIEILAWQPLPEPYKADMNNL